MDANRYAKLPSQTSCYSRHSQRPHHCCQITWRISTTGKLQHGQVSWGRESRPPANTWFFGPHKPTPQTTPRSVQHSSQLRPTDRLTRLHLWQYSTSLHSTYVMQPNMTNRKNTIKIQGKKRYFDVPAVFAQLTIASNRETDIIDHITSVEI